MTKSLNKCPCSCKDIKFALDTLRDLTALYASTKGHDPVFVQKGQAAIQKLQQKSC